MNKKLKSLESLANFCGSCIRCVNLPLESDDAWLERFKTKKYHYMTIKYSTKGDDIMISLCGKIRR